MIMIKKNLFALLCLLTLTLAVKAQDKFFTKSGKIEFSSKAPMEDIEAHNRSVTTVLDTKTGNLQLSLQMKGFEFAKALMQEHFNEDFVESDKYPKAEFRGSIVNNSDVNYMRDGDYPIKVKGALTLHGVTREVESDGRIMVKEGKLLSTSDFAVQIGDYNISIPSLVREKVSKTVTIKVDCVLIPLGN